MTKSSASTSSSSSESTVDLTKSCCKNVKPSKKTKSCSSVNHHNVSKNTIKKTIEKVGVELPSKCEGQFGVFVTDDYHAVFDVYTYIFYTAEYGTYINNYERMSRFRIRDFPTKIVIPINHLRCCIEPRKGVFKKEKDMTCKIHLKGNLFEVFMHFNKDNVYVMVRSLEIVVPCSVILKDDLKLMNIRSFHKDLVCVFFGCK